jgi:hypothetical protein
LTRTGLSVINQNISYQERQRDWPYEARQPIFTVPIPEDERGIDVTVKSLPPGGFFFAAGRKWRLDKLKV